MANYSMHTVSQLKVVYGIPTRKKSTKQFDEFSFITNNFELNHQIISLLLIVI